MGIRTVSCLLAVCFIHCASEAIAAGAGTLASLSPAPFSLSGGAYEFNHWNDTQPAGAYPPNMLFLQTSGPDPDLEAEMDSLWTLPYNLASRSRINGLGEAGFAFINTGNAQEIEGAGYLGAALLALDTTEQENIRVVWTGGTVLANSRVYGIRLQFRIGTEAAFQDVLDGGGNPVEYIRNNADGHFETIGPVILPETANNQSVVQLRWKYYYISGASGPRAQLRLDDLRVTSGHPPAQKLALTEAPPTGQTGQPLRAIVVQAQSNEGDLATSYNGPVTLLIVGEPTQVTGTLTRTASGGVVSFDDIVFHSTGTWTLVATASGLSSASSGPIVIAELNEEIMPLHIQGEQPENNNRVPFVFRLKISGLLPNATYRYANRIVTAFDSPTQDGAGNALFVKSNGADFIRTTSSPRFLADDLDLRHAEFQTDAGGVYTGWFITEPSGNSRFAPGNSVFVRLLLNDGMGGESFHHFLTATNPISVLEFGDGPDQATALYGESNVAGKEFLSFFGETDGSGRPLAVAVVEATGALLDNRYAPFYELLVAGQSGRWGTLLPNALEAGVRRVETRSLLTGEIEAVSIFPDGIFPTIQPSTGANPVGIRIPDVEDSGYPRWAAGFFSLDELANTDISGPLADADDDDLPNLLEYALVLHPRTPSTSGLPEAQLQEENGGHFLQYQFRRRTDDPFLQYVVRISEDLFAWEDADDQLTWLENEPIGDGIALSTALLPIDASQPGNFLRLKVIQTLPEPPPADGSVGMPQ